MKIADIGKNSAILASPKPLDGDTPIMGIPARDWDQALTGCLQEKLDRLKALAEATPPREVTADTQVDLASIARALRDENE